MIVFWGGIFFWYLEVLCIDDDDTVGVQAWADAYASTYDCKETCLVEATAAADAVGSVLAKAASEAYASVCAGMLRYPSLLRMHPSRAAPPLLFHNNSRCC
jgi:hypothetical protein